jgi:hypothetical protein
MQGRGAVHGALLDVRSLVEQPVQRDAVAALCGGDERRRALGSAEGGWRDEGGCYETQSTDLHRMPSREAAKRGLERVYKPESPAGMEGRPWLQRPAPGRISWP